MTRRGASFRAPAKGPGGGKRRPRRVKLGPAAAILQGKLRRKEEPTLEDLLAVIGEMRDMVVPPEWRSPDEVTDVTSRVAPAASIEDFERNVLSEAWQGLRDDLEAMQAASHEALSEMVLDGYWRLQEACARDPENTELAALEKKMRGILENGMGGRVPTREEWEADRQWEGEET